MKFLINSEFEIVMKGDAINSDKLDDSEFIYETGGKTKLTINQLNEIAEANGVKIKGKKVSELSKSLDEKLTKIKNIPEKKEMTDSEKVIKIVEAGFKAEKEEDDILIEIVKSGIGFKDAMKRMKVAMIELGLSVSSKDRYEKAASIMDDEDFEPENYDDVLEMVAQISKDINSTSESQALKEIRKYCKANTIELPKKVKIKSSPFAVRAIAWMILNHDSSAEDFIEAFENDKEKLVAQWSEKFDGAKVEVEKMEKAAE